MFASEPLRRARTLADVFRLAAEQHGEHAAFCPRQEDGSFGAVSFRQLYDDGLAVATALIELGVQPREHVAVLADNRLEWIQTDYGVLLAGAADVPRGTDVTVGEIEYILNHADVRVVVAEDERVLAKIERCRARVPQLRTIIAMDAPESAPAAAGIVRFGELLARGRALRAQGDRRAEERIAAVRPEDLFTLIYTSGTTGRPKGVPLTHANMVSQVLNLPFHLSVRDRMLSILPIWHSYERVAHMVAIAYGAATYYTSVRTVGDDLKSVRPTFMTSAPRLWESLYNKILQNVSQCAPTKRAMFRVAYFFSRRLRHSAYFVEGRRLDLVGRAWWRSLLQGIGEGLIYLALLAPYLVMDGLVTRKLRAILGGAFRGTVSGGGALPRHVDEFFNYIGIPVLEGYGLTEASPVLAARTWSKRVIGTVGPPWPETDIRIVDLTSGAVLYPDPSRRDRGRGLRGEIHAKGPQVMSGYYKDPELTARVLKDGWFATGDIGMITFNDCLKILGRCKETIVLLSGENVEPAPIENKLCESPYIHQCIVVGQDQKHLAALIVPQPERFAENGITWSAPAELSGNPAIERIIAREIKAHVNAQSGFRHFEMIHAWRLLPKPFELGEELTSTYKLKRHVIADKYADLIREIYHVPKGGVETRL